MRKTEYLLVVGVIFGGLLSAGCGSGGTPNTNPGQTCTGDLRCACFGNSTCNGKLVCLSNLCVDPNEIAGTGGVTGSGGASGPASSSACTDGIERCPCYPNNTCNTGLVCASEVCVALAGTGGLAATGGVIGTGGLVVATGGVLGTGGIVIGTGGVVGTGGIVIGTGGLLSTGGIVIGTGGVLGTGGIVIGAGGVLSTGGAVIGTGGATASSQVCTDTTHCYLGIDGGAVPAAGNTYGIDGGFYVVGDPCTQASIVWDAASHCASGTICAKDPPYYQNWGVEIGLALKSSGGYSYPYDATANGVSGFFWEVTGTAPGMAVWVPLAAGSNACLMTSNNCTLLQPPWGNPLPSMGPGGNNYLTFGTMTYDDWGLDYFYPPPWDATRLDSIQWKVPARDFATPFSFCVQKVGVIHN